MHTAVRAAQAALTIVPVTSGLGQSSRGLADSGDLR